MASRVALDGKGGMEMRWKQDKKQKKANETHGMLEWDMARTGDTVLWYCTQTIISSHRGGYTTRYGRVVLQLGTVLHPLRHGQDPETAEVKL